MTLMLESVLDRMRRSDQPQPALGKAIRLLREKQGATQEDLAYKAGVTTGTLSLIERGHANPTWSTVRSIAAALERTMAELSALADRQ